MESYQRTMLLVTAFFLALGVWAFGVIRTELDIAAKKISDRLGPWRAATRTCNW